MREFAAYFEESDSSRIPIQEDMDLGLIVCNIFDLYDRKVRKEPQPKLSLFHAVMYQGVIDVPPYDSADLRYRHTADK